MAACPVGRVLTHSLQDIMQGFTGLNGETTKQARKIEEVDALFLLFLSRYPSDIRRIHLSDTGKDSPSRGFF